MSNSTARFLQRNPTPGEALVWLAYQRAEATPGILTFLEAVDAVLLDARCEAVKTFSKLNERLDREDARAAKLKLKTS